MNSEEEKKTIFKQIYLSWNGDEAKEEFINGIKRLLKSKGYKITDSNDRLTEPDVNGSKIINNIKECSLVVGIFFDEKTYTRRISHQNLEEKGIALAAGKRIFYFKEEGIEDITLGTFLEHITIVPFTWETLVSRLFDLLDHLPPA